MKVNFPRQLLVVLLAKSLAILCDSSFTVSRRSGLGRLLEVVVYERFQYKASTESILLFWEGGRLRWSQVEVRLYL